MSNYLNAAKIKFPDKIVTRATSDTYEGLEWNTLDGLPIPTKAELDAAIAELATGSMDINKVPVVITNVLGGSDASTVSVLTPTGVTPGDYDRVSVDQKGRITAGLPPTIITPAGIGAVANAGNAPSIATGTLDSRPEPGILGRIYVCSSNGLIYHDALTKWNVVGIGNSGIGTGGIFQSMTGVYGASSGTTIIPTDTTTPLVTEGTAIWTGNITLDSAGSKVRISSSFWMDCNTNGRSVTVALFRNGECIQAQNSYFKNIGQPMQVALEVVDSPASNIAVTYSCRVGVNNSATWYINQSANGAITYGGVVNRSTYVLMEIL